MVVQVGLVKEQPSWKAWTIFIAAAWNGVIPGCSMCLAMKPDRLESGEQLRFHIQPQL